MHRGQRKDGVSKVYGRKIKFVRFVRTFRFESDKVYAERSG